MVGRAPNSRALLDVLDCCRQVAGKGGVDVRGLISSLDRTVSGSTGTKPVPLKLDSISLTKKNPQLAELLARDDFLSV
jgi:hypothetical protein